MKKKSIIFTICFFTIICSSFSINYTWDLVYFQDINKVFIGIDSPDSMNVIATTSYGRFRQILKSTDAGISWGNVFEDSIDYKSPKQTWPRDMSYPTNNFCIVSCDSNYFLKTIDGGKTWKENQIDTLFEDRGLQHVSMFDDKFGIMTSRHYMFISDDGFESWKHLPLPGWYTIISLQMISPDIITFIGVVYDGSPNYDEKFFKSTDRGKTWAEYPYPNYIFLTELDSSIL